MHVFRATLGHVGGENKKKLNSLFFLVAVGCSTTEDSPTEEYSECALRVIPELFRVYFQT